MAAFVVLGGAAAPGPGALTPTGAHEIVWATFGPDAVATGLQ